MWPVIQGLYGVLGILGHPEFQLWKKRNQQGLLGLHCWFAFRIQPHFPSSPAVQQRPAPRSGCCWIHGVKHPPLLPLSLWPLQNLSFLTDTNFVNLSITKALRIWLWPGHQWYLHGCALLLRLKPCGLWKGQFSHACIPWFCMYPMVLLIFPTFRSVFSTLPLWSQ